MYLALLLALAFFLLIRKHRGYNDDARDNGLVIGGNIHNLEPAGQGAENDGSHQCISNLPFPPDKEIPPMTAEAMAFIS